jgi:hypothetical protein
VATIILIEVWHTLSCSSRVNKAIYWCVCRWRLHEAGLRDHGGAGLVSGPTGDHPDASLRVRHGVAKGRTYISFVSVSLATGSVRYGNRVIVPTCTWSLYCSFRTFIRHCTYLYEMGRSMPVYHTGTSFCSWSSYPHLSINKSINLSLSLSLSLSLYIYIYIYIHTYTWVYLNFSDTVSLFRF